MTPEQLLAVVVEAPVGSCVTGLAPEEDGEHRSYYERTPDGWQHVIDGSQGDLVGPDDMYGDTVSEVAEELRRSEGVWISLPL